jgi:hypothetical protein
MVKRIVVNFMAGAGKADTAVVIAVDQVVIKLGRSGIDVRHNTGALHRAGAAIEYPIEPDHITCSRPAQMDTRAIKVKLVRVSDCIVLDYIVTRPGIAKHHPASSRIMNVIAGDGVATCKHIEPGSDEDAVFKGRSYFVIGYGVVIGIPDSDPGPPMEHTRVID